ncbi:DPP IV N-terminal domain-containing protein [uncultured Sphingomonas sp.]|uniref:DPP IV N-terminal domain-containing protein n=1 Tax=uncultured Sphingomonas sp. TaxID=158754 RepID=UPI0025CFA53E|nr:DPP IV N-terminal domain-containing protein [uncultured Sphingomonas sp.]
MTMPAQAEDLTLQRVFASPNLAGEQPRALKLSPDGRLLTSLRPRAEEKDRFDLWAMDTSTGQWRMLVDSKKVGSGAELSEAEKMQRERARIGGQRGIVAYQWSSDGTSILVPLDGDLYLATLDGKVTRLTNTPGGELNPLVSPRGQYLSFVRDQNLYVSDLNGGDARKITPDGAGTVHWGEAEFVAQEEMDRTTGYWWSPDERYVAVERFDEAPVGTVVRAAIGAEDTKVFEQRYPAAGTSNVLVDLYVMRPDGTGSVKVDLGKDRDIYLARVKWAPDGNTLYVQRQNREQTVLDVLKVDPATGASSVLFTEKSGPKSWVNLSNVFVPMQDGSIIWWSERDGHGHLYRFATGKWTQLTKGAWEVAGLNGVDEQGGKLYFNGNKDGALERHIYALDLKSLATTRLTEAGWWNNATADSSATRFIVERSNPTQPTQVYLADGSGKRLSWINENAVRPGHPYHPYLSGHAETKFGSLKTADGETLYWEMLTPKLEPGKTYPVFFEHYGGPHSQTVTRNWGPPLHQLLVDKGYIVFMIDNRGSANRGKAFEDAIWHAMGGVEVRDQLAGVDYLKTLDFVDPKRIATYGWSYGGYMTLKMLEANPGVYAAGISGAPVTRWELYDTHYTERYMGTDPKGRDKAAYAKSAAVEDGPKISDPLLLIHGMADDNVVLDNSTAFAAKMQATNTPFEMMFYPGKTHSASRDIHVWTTILNFLDRTVGAGPK